MFVKVYCSGIYIIYCVTEHQHAEVNDSLKLPVWQVLELLDFWDIAKDLLDLPTCFAMWQDTEIKYVFTESIHFKSIVITF